MIQTNQILAPQNENQKPILYDLYLPESPERMPLVIFAHGYKGFKDWGPWNLVAENFATAGIGFLKFNFSHNGGTMKHPIDFPDLEAFAQNNYSTELDDLKRILDFVTNEKEDSLPDFKSITLIGHSRGGGVSMIKAEEDSRVDKLIGWASVSDFLPRFQVGTDNFKQWKKTGVTYVENTRTKQQLPHNYQFYEDFVANEERFSIKRAAKNLKIPFLIIQGAADSSVVMAEAQALHQWNKNSILKVIPGADHVFGGKHPWNGTQLPEDLKKVVQETIDFIK